MRSLICGVFLAINGAYAAPPVPPEPPEGGSELPSSNEGLSGKEVYLKECAVCHGKEGEGTDRGFSVRFPVAVYAEAVTRAGRDGAGVFSIPMPAYTAAQVSDQQLREMWQYLSSFSRPKTGAELFATFCQNCHGKDGRGGVVGKGVLGEIGEFREVIREGEHRSQPLRRRKYMPAYSRSLISDADIWLLENYARELRTAGRGRGGSHDDDHDHHGEDGDDDDKHEHGHDDHDDD